MKFQLLAGTGQSPAGTGPQPCVAGAADSAHRDHHQARAGFGLIIASGGVGFEAGKAEGANVEPFRATVEIDGEKRELVTTSITVANLAPPTFISARGFSQVIPDDGLIEIAIASATSGLTDLTMLCFRARRIRISTDPPQRLVVDSEILDANSVEFNGVPWGLTLLAPLAMG